MLPFSRFRVAGKSMEPNFYEGDYVLVNRLSYAFSRPKEGHVIVFRHPKGAMIKRIRKIRGDKIYVAGDGMESSKLIIPQDKIIGKVLLKVKKHQ